MLLFTGAHLQDVLTATWEQFDLEKGVWVKPSRLTKSQTTTYLPLSEQVLHLVREWRMRATSESRYLFPDRTGNKPIKDISY